MLENIRLLVDYEKTEMAKNDKNVTRARLLFVNAIILIEKLFSNFTWIKILYRMKFTLKISCSLSNGGTGRMLLETKNSLSPYNELDLSSTVITKVR